MEQVRRPRHPTSPRVSLVPGAGIQTVGEGLQAPILTAIQLPPARAPPGRIFQTFGRLAKGGEGSILALPLLTFLAGEAVQRR